MHVHLGLAGKWYFVDDDDARPVVGQIRWRLENDRHYADLRGATACELLGADRQAEITGPLGPDPLRDDADPDVAWQRVRVSRCRSALLLMDQRVIGRRRQHLPGRGALSAPARPDDGRPAAATRRVEQRVSPTWSD